MLTSELIRRGACEPLKCVRRYHWNGLGRRAKKREQGRERRTDHKTPKEKKQNRTEPTKWMTEREREETENGCRAQERSEEAAKGK